MTSLLDLKTASNEQISDSSRNFYPMSDSIRTRKAKQRKPGSGNTGLGLLITGFIGSQSVKISNPFDLLNNTSFGHTTVFEERIKRKLTLDEACRVSLRNLRGYEKIWDDYLKQEYDKVFFIDEF